MNIFRSFRFFAELPFIPKATFASSRSINLNAVYEPNMLPGTDANIARTNILPRDYERMMQKVMFRIGPTTLFTKRLKRMTLSKREVKHSEDARMSTPEGRVMIYRRLLNEKSSLWPFGK